MIDRTRLLASLFRYGYFWNPATPETLNVQQSDLARLTLDDAVVKDALRSWQLADANFDALAFLLHLRAVIADGDAGPVTAAMLDVPRCPMPDYPPPPGAAFDFGDPGLNQAVESMRAAAMGSGSWPSCDPDRPGVNSFRVRINTSRIPSTVQGYFDKALKAVVECYAEVGCALRYITGASGDCEIEKRFEALSGSVIGWNEFPQPNTCNQTISGRLDTGYAPSDYRYWANLEAHETGHGVGLQHTRGHIMNPSILLIWPLSWKGGPSEASMNRYFGGLPIPVPGDPVPPPLGPVPPTDHNGVFLYQGKLLKIKVFE